MPLRQHLWVIEIYCFTQMGFSFAFIVDLWAKISFTLTFAAICFFQNQRARSVFMHLLQIRLFKYRFAILKVYGNNGWFQTKCSYFREVIKTASETKETVAQKAYAESFLLTKSQMNAFFKSTMWKYLVLKTYSGSLLLRNTQIDVNLVRKEE